VPTTRSAGSADAPAATPDGDRTAHSNPRPGSPDHGPCLLRGARPRLRSDQFINPLQAQDQQEFGDRGQSVAARGPADRAGRRGTGAGGVEPLPPPVSTTHGHSPV
jgi:hypothetical protein